MPMTLNLDLDEQQTKRLEEVARSLKVSVDDLAKAAINDLLANPKAISNGLPRVFSPRTPRYTSGWPDAVFDAWGTH